MSVQNFGSATATLIFVVTVSPNVLDKILPLQVSHWNIRDLSDLVYCASTEVNVGLAKRKKSHGLGQLIPGWRALLFLHSGAASLTNLGVCSSRFSRSCSVVAAFPSHVAQYDNIAPATVCSRLKWQRRE